MAFPSVYEMFTPLTTVRKQHFWEYFSGATLNSRWTQNNVTGTGTFEMAGEADGGFKITTANSSTGKNTITFNDKRQFNYDSSVFIAVVKNHTTTVNCGQATGLCNGQDVTVSHATIGGNANVDTYMNLSTRDGATSRIQGTVTLDLSWHTVKGELGSSNVKSYIDGTLDVTKTSNLPNAKLQPIMRMNSTSGDGGKVGSIKYFEAYNT